MACLVFRKAVRVIRKWRRPYLTRPILTRRTCIFLCRSPIVARCWLGPPDCRAHPFKHSLSITYGRRKEENCQKPPSLTRALPAVAAVTQLGGGGLCPLGAMAVDLPGIKTRDKKLNPCLAWLHNALLSEGTQDMHFSRDAAVIVFAFFWLRCFDAGDQHFGPPQLGERGGSWEVVWCSLLGTSVKALHDLITRLRGS